MPVRCSFLDSMLLWSCPVPWSVLHLITLLSNSFLAMGHVSVKDRLYQHTQRACSLGLFCVQAPVTGDTGIWGQLLGSLPEPMYWRDPSHT